MPRFAFVGVLPMNNETGSASVVASEVDPSAPSRPPRRRERKKSTPPSPKLTSNGLPPTPKVHMGACFSKVFNGCPLGIHGTASWVHPETRDQHILIAAEEGLYTLNLNQLHDAYVHLLYPRRTIWMVVVKGSLCLPHYCVLCGAYNIFVSARRCFNDFIGKDAAFVQTRIDSAA